MSLSNKIQVCSFPPEQMSGKIPSSYAERAKAVNPFEALERRVDLVASDPMTFQQFQAIHAEIRKATVAAAQSYESIFKGVNAAHPGAIDMGRCIASLDALLAAKNTAFDAINLPSIIATRPIITNTPNPQETRKEDSPHVLAEDYDDDKLSVEELPSTLPLQEKGKRTMATKSVYIGHVDSEKRWACFIEDAIDIGIVRRVSALIWNKVNETAFGFITMKYVEDAEALMAKIGDDPWFYDIDCDYYGASLIKRRIPYAQWNRPAEKNKQKHKTTQAEKKKKATRRDTPTQ